jgi:hypothetical protein
MSYPPALNEPLSILSESVYYFRQDNRRLICQHAGHSESLLVTSKYSFPPVLAKILECPD